MPNTYPQYPFDPTGTLTSNKIIGEQHIITPVNRRDFNFIVPVAAPFFATSFQLSFKNTLNETIILEENVDYYLTHWFISASRACAKPIYGSITLLNNDLSGVLTVTYQTLGGDWTLDQRQLTELLADKTHNPRITSWDSVSEMPYSFPVIDHPWDLIDMVGLSELTDKLNDIKNAILATGEGVGIEAHIVDYNNPHNVNKNQVGLGNLMNYPMANNTVAIEGTEGAYYMSPLTTRAAFNNLIASRDQTIASHISDTNNPHNVTADQVGAYSKSESNNRYLGKNDVAADTLLFNGQDFIALQTEILAGTASNSSRFNGLTYQEFVSSLDNISVGDAERFDGKTYQEAKDDILTGTAANSTNFDGKTYQQTKDDILSGTAYDSDRLGGMTYAEIIQSIQQMSGDASTFQGRTFSEATDEILSGTAANSDMVFGLDETGVEDMITDISINTVKSVRRLHPPYTNNQIDYAWTLLSTFSLSQFGLGIDLSSDVNITLHIDGGEYSIKVNTGGNSPVLEVYTIKTSWNEVEFGITSIEDNLYNLWVKHESSRGVISLISVGGGLINLIEDSESVVETEPSNIDYTLDTNNTFNNVSLELIEAIVDSFNTKIQDIIVTLNQ